MEFESKLIPVMREGIEVVKMITFKKLREQLGEAHPEQDPIFLSRLTGAVLNLVFDTPNTQEPFASFATENKELIEAELKRLPTVMPEMLIPLTDALRMQTICDLQEERGASGLLHRLNEWGILLADRDLPLPHTFMDMVRKLGAAFDLIVPPIPADDSEEAPPH